MNPTRLCGDGDVGTMDGESAKPHLPKVLSGSKEPEAGDDMFAGFSTMSYTYLTPKIFNTQD